MSDAVARGPEPALKAAYADPPYLGCAAKHYGRSHAEAAEYDALETHRHLVERLCADDDCWALSLHEPSLRRLLPLCPAEVRVAAWVKPFAAYKVGVTRAYTWEPVIFRFSPRRPRSRRQATWRDSLSAHPTRLRGVPGAKPPPFSYWLFAGLNLLPHDEFHDLFPGSGAVAEAWERWRNRDDPEQIPLLDGVAERRT